MVGTASRVVGTGEIDYGTGGSVFGKRVFEYENSSRVDERDDGAESDSRLSP